MVDRAWEGVPLAAVALDRQGNRMRSDQVRIYAELGQRRTPLVESQVFWKSRIPGLDMGDYPVRLIAEGANLEGTGTHLRVTDGNFLGLDSSRHFITHRGRIKGPLTGSHQGTFFFREVGKPDESMVNGQKAWDAWKEKTRAGDRLHYWDSLTDHELDQRFAYLARCGWDLVYLLVHWSFWERLDAGGRIAPSWRGAAGSLSANSSAPRIVPYASPLALSLCQSRGKQKYKHYSLCAVPRGRVPNRRLAEARK